jgi:hypothetical protein
MRSSENTEPSSVIHFKPANGDSIGLDGTPIGWFAAPTRATLSDNVDRKLQLRYAITLLVQNLVNSGNSGAVNLIRMRYTINHSILMASLETLKQVTNLPDISAVFIMIRISIWKVNRIF